VLINLISWPTSTAVLHHTVSSVKSVHKITAAKRDVNRGNYNTKTTCQCNEKAYCTTLAQLVVFVRNTMRHQRWAAQAGYRSPLVYMTAQLQAAQLVFNDNFGKSGPIFMFISLLNSERICGGSWRHNMPPPAVRRTLRPSCSPSLTPAAPSAPCFQ